MNELILRLSDLEYIKIMTRDGVAFTEVDYCCGEIVMYYFLQNNKICIGEQTAGLFFTALIKRMIKVIEYHLQLDSSILENLGILENEYCHELPYIGSKFVMISIKDSHETYWVGEKYALCNTYNTTNPKLSTWLYHDKQKILLEVTPLYKWSFIPDDLDDPDFITYDEFMKNYKPLIHRVIPHQIAVQWLDQLMQAYRSLFTNEQNFLAACDEIEKI